MPEIEIKSQMPLADILEILRQVWHLPNTEKSKIIASADHARLHEDIAAICAFLSDRNLVIQNLRPLDEAIRAELEKEERLELRSKVASAITNQNARELRFKTQKLLSGLLDEFEKLNGFNSLLDSAASRGKLHTTAHTLGDGASAAAMPATWTPYNPESKAVKDLPQIDLPRGVPTLTGVLEKSFNPVLLRHGYHWKDPGADAVIHGEFTHRIQWYAIITAARTGTLPLTNAPIQIFKSMGYASFTTTQNEGKNTYLWVLACDCFGEDQKKSAPAQPWSKTFNCPNVLNAYLSKPMDPTAWNELSYLKAVLAGRRLKRQGEDAIKTDLAITSGTKPVKFGITSPEDKGGAIWWPQR